MVALASVSEAFPYAVVEAMLTQSAIVATDVGGVREALGDAGLLVYPRDPVALAEAISTLLSERSMRRAALRKGASPPNSASRSR